jgi:V8-like Glu-specific endopeptidase
MFDYGCLIAGSVTQEHEWLGKGRAGHDVSAEPAAAPAATAAPSASGVGGAAADRRRARACRRVCLVLTLAAGLTLAAVGLIATPLDQDLDTTPAGAQSLAPALQTQSVSFAGTPAVGALFTTTGGGLGGHFCSASVVNSPAQDLLITAAHCVSGNGSGPIAFVPGYDNGRMPYGIWRVTRVILGPTWISSANPNADVAFLVVAGQHGTKIQDVTGGEQLGLGQAVGQIVSVIGYPETANAPIRCNNLVHGYSPTQLEFDCGGYTDGTSGGPLLENVNPATGMGTVVGVIGGYEQGGDTPNVSYAARFGALVADLYKTATGQ